MPTVVGSVSGTGVSSLVVPVTADVAVGDFLVVVYGEGYGDGEVLSSVTDSRGNSYTIDFAEGNVDGDGVVAVASCTVGTALTTSDSITLELSESIGTYTASAYAVDFGDGFSGFVAHGSGSVGWHDGSATISYTTATAAPLVIAAAAAQTVLTPDEAHDWDYVVTGGGDPPANIMDVGYQTPGEGAALTFTPDSTGGGYGGAVVIEYHWVDPITPGPAGEGVAPTGGSVYGGVWLAPPSFPAPPPSPYPPGPYPSPPVYPVPPPYPAPFPPLSQIVNPTDVRLILTSTIPQPAAPYTAFQPVMELPFNNLSFTLTFNQAGSFSVEFQTEEAAMRASNWYNWTTPGKSFLWIIVGGTLIYGGRIMNREATKSTQKCTLTGSDFYSYWAQQMQFRDYTSFLQTYTTAGGVDKQFLWAGNYGLGAPAPLIAITLMRDKGAADFFLPLLHTPHHGLGAGTSTDPDTWINAIPSANWIEFSAPIAQMQTVDTLVQQMVQLGYPIGCDVFTRPAWDDASGTNTGTPHAPYVNQYVSWPRMGADAAQLGTAIQVLDLNAALEVKWTEDATSQTTNMWEQIGQNAAIWDGPYPNTFAMQTHHWPLMEQAFSHSYVNPVYLRNELLAQIQQGDKNVYSFPQLAPVVTVPCFAPSAFDLLSVASTLGNDLTVSNGYDPDDPAQIAPGLPFPPPGWTDTMRLIQADVTIPDKGVATMDLTLNMPPNRQNPPIYEPNPSF